MKKSLHVKTISLILALFVAIFATGTVFAWFSSQYWNLDLAGNSAGSYFAYGDGTSVKRKYKEGDETIGQPWDGVDESEWDKSTGPFGIDRPVHMFNLAWLQNIGRFEGDTYYFELADTVDMREDGKTTVIPPIGNTTYAFNGVFEGNGKTIKNLIVSTNKKVLDESLANASYTFSPAVGLFGLTGEDSVIKNFILEYPTVEVALNGTYNGLTQETLYSEPSETDPLVVGIAVGYVAGTVQSIGVRGGTLAVRTPGYKTFNSILGELDPNIEDGDHTITGSGSDGDGSTFGATFNVARMAERLRLINQNNNSDDPSLFLPQTKEVKNSESPVPSLGYKIPFAVTNTVDEAYYTGSNVTETVSKNNVGYFFGDLNTINTITFKFTDTEASFAAQPMKNNGYGQYYLYGQDKTFPDANNVPRWFYTQTGGWTNSNFYTGNGFGVMSQEKYNSLPQSLKDLLYTTEHTAILVNGNYSQGSTVPYYSDKTEYLADEWSRHGQITWMGKTYGDGLNIGGYSATMDGFFYDKGGHLIDEDGYLFMFETDDEGNYLYDEAGERIRNYAAGPDLTNLKNFYLTEEGYFYSPYDGSGYFVDKNGEKFYAFGDYGYRNGTFYYKDTGEEIFVYHPNDRNTPVKVVQVKSTTKVSAANDSRGIILPNSGIWFKPVELGFCRFVMYATESGQNFRLMKITRENADETNPFRADSGSEMRVESVEQQFLPANALFYFEVEIKNKEELYNTEYLIKTDNNAPGAYFLYIDMGASGDENAKKDTEKADPEKRVTAIDFIYSGVTITQDDIPLNDGTDNVIPAGSFVFNGKIYVESRTMLTFGGSGAIVAFYYRQDDQSADPTIRAAYSGGMTLVSSNESKADFGFTIPAGWPDRVDADLDNGDWKLL